MTGSKATAHRRRFRPFVILAWITAGLLILAALGLLLENALAERAWNNYLAQLKAAGEPTTEAEVLREAPADAENFAMIPLLRPLRDYHREPKQPGELAGRVISHDPTGLRAAKPGRPFPNDLPTRYRDAWYSSTWRQAWQEGKLADLTLLDETARHVHAADKEPLPDAPAGAAIRAHLAQYDERLAQLREGATRPRAQFAPDYSAGALTETGQGAILDYCKILKAHAFSNLALGRAREAHEDVLLDLRMANLMRDEPMSVGFIFRLAVNNIALGPLWEGLARRAWDDAQLTALERELTACDLVTGYRFAMVSEKVLGTWPFYDGLSQRPAQIGFVLPVQNHAVSVLLGLTPAGAYTFNKVHASEYLDRLAKVADPHHARIDLSEVATLTRGYIARRDGGGVKKWNPNTLLAEALGPPLLSISESAAHVQASVNLARCAVALERYRLKHGEYPGRLADLEPAFPALPNDPISGEPVRYRREPDGTFTLYLVSGNLRDDGGKPAPKLPSRKVDLYHDDLVWPRLKP